ncbi:lmo0937 family membrane protein [Pseudomonas sp. PDM23]|nr:MULTISPECIES: lmo0937 family membrane protein [unclassified Pseudomonas]MBD9503762.1 lmo0937 family membrane protein [Pseudomonas sp. PDM17]MBD9513695.1 lmo0937 family membrane protein [Pseudomonas sp. PDM22]MBD9574820.1 lmo0937 family membrane protein [Pseudomonas sp. PDM23]MBD9630000.1 lmo0937 family membrane protein [Pseudomonas sp. PDM19]MBD9672977.1 lmo0937 family membrane protein [Pseudomonas sp. PDM21]
MLETVVVCLLILWALGMFTAYTLGGFIHVLLIAAVAIVVMRMLQGRRPS